MNIPCYRKCYRDKKKSNNTSADIKRREKMSKHKHNTHKNEQELQE